MDGIKLVSEINTALEQIANKDTLSVTEIVEKLKSALPSDIEFMLPNERAKRRQKFRRLKLIKEVWKLQKHR